MLAYDTDNGGSCFPANASFPESTDAQWQRKPTQNVNRVISVQHIVGGTQPAITELMTKWRQWPGRPITELPRRLTFGATIASIMP